MYDPFGLVLMVNHACNLRCTYCYNGRKFNRCMPLGIALKALDRAVRSLAAGGTLELGFFGGEPLLEAGLIRQVLHHARLRAASDGFQLAAYVTTNGTAADPEADELLGDPGLAVSISVDGLPDIHDRHRRYADGLATSADVLATCLALLEAGKPFTAVMTVRPDTVRELPENLRFLRALGVKLVEPALDLWTAWTGADLDQLDRAIHESVVVWRQGLPEFGVSWFNEKLAERAGVTPPPTARCGFGKAEIAVAPSGRLYPCERLIGEDRPDQPLRLPGDVGDGDDFLETDAPETGGAERCGLSCPCCNYVRTGSVKRPDALLKRLDTACAHAVASVLERGASGRLEIRAAREEGVTYVHA